MPVAITGFNWNTVILVIQALLGGGVLVALIRSRTQTKKIDNDREANLLKERSDEMAKMRDRIEKLEKLQEEKDQQHADEREADRLRHEAERAHDRHKMNNLDQCLHALLMLIEQDPNKAAEAASTIRKMRADQLVRETAEKATIRAAAIAGVSP